MEQFVSEANELIKDGVILDGKKYALKISVVIADAPARAFLKCCKHPGGFFACERCTTKGETVTTNNFRKKSTKKTVTRVYPEVNCELRTKESFTNKS